MTASIRSLRSFFAAICNTSASRPGSVASLLLVIGLFHCTPDAGATTTSASFSGGYEVLGGTLTYPTGVAVDTSGNVYLAMPALSAVQEIPASCIAGANDNTCVITLGGGFSNPIGVAVDASGNVYVADTDNDAIKKISASCISGANDAGCVVTLGGGFKEPYGVAVDGSGNVFVADTFKSKVKEIPASCIIGNNNAGCVEELGTGAFASPTGIAVDASGNVYVGDTGNETVDEIPHSCMIGANNYTCVITLGGGFDSPYGVAVDASGNVFVADAGNSTVSEIPVSCIAGSNDASCVLPVGGGFVDPYGVAAGASGIIYVADTSNWAVKKIWLHGVDFGTVPVATSTLVMRSLIFVFTSGGTIGAPVVVTSGATGQDFTDAGTGSCTTQGTSHTYSIGDVCTVDVNLTPLHPGPRNGAVLLEGYSSHVLATGYIHGIGASPQVIFMPGVQSALGAGLNQPYGIAVDGSGNVFVADHMHNAVKKILSNCTTDCVSTIGGGFSAPYGIALDGAGNVLVTDFGNNAVKEIPNGCTSSSCVITLGGEITDPTGIAVDNSGNVFVGSGDGNTVNEIPNGCLLSSCMSVIGGGFSSPYGIAVDSSDNVYVADFNHHAVKEIPNGCTSSSCVITLGGAVSAPYGVAVDASGNVFVGDSDTSAVREIPGGCTQSNCMSALSGTFLFPIGVALGGNGNIYVSDAARTAVAMLDFADPPSLNFATTSIGFTSSDSPQTVVVVNDGNQSLNFTGLRLPGDFVLNSSGGSVCSSSTTLAASSFCTLPIDFTPAIIGSLSESLTLTDNNLNAPASPGAQQSISLSSTGNPAPDSTTTYVAISPSLLNSGLTATVTATVNDTGVRGTTPTGTVTFSWSCSGICAYDTTSTSGSASGSLNGGNPVTLVSGVATLTGVSNFNKAGTYTVTASYSGVSETFLSSSNSGQSDSANQTTVSWAAATATAAAAASLGSVSIGNSVKQTVTFTIQTAGAIGSPVVVTEGATGLDFTDALDGTCTTTNGGSYGYNASETCTVDVQFAPQYPGIRYGAVLLEDGFGNVLATAYLHGTGTGPQSVFANTTSGAFVPNSTTALGGGFSSPNFTAVDQSGNVYVADYNNNAVKEIPASCIATANNSSCVLTLGGGFSYPVGVAVDGAGNVIVGDAGHSAVKMIPASCIAGANNSSCVIPLGGSFSWNWPSGVAVDGSGNVYVADMNLNAVMEILAAGNYTTVNTLSSGFTTLTGVAVDGSGNVFVTDQGTNQVSEILAAGGYTTVIALGSGFSVPLGVAVDTNGDVYVTDTGHSHVKEIMAVGGSIPATPTINMLGSGFSAPLGVALDRSGNVYVTDGNAVEKLDFADTPTLSFDTTAVGFSSTDSPQTVTVTNDGNATLAFSGLSTPSDFPLDSSGGSVCSSTTTLAASATCTLPIDFTPVGSSPYSTTSLNENLSLTNNSLNVSSNSQSISVSGTGTAPTITFSSPSSTTLTSGTVGVSYSVSFTATGGAGPYTYSSYWVPDGLTLSSGGTLSGTPTKASSHYRIDVKATDANGFSVRQRYTLAINQGTAIINVTPYSVTYNASAHTATGTATGYNSEDLSSGLTLSGTTHTNAGSYTTDAWSFHDSAGNYADDSGTVSDTISQATATINITPYSVTYNASAHTASGTATGVSSVNLSAGLTLSGTTHTNAGSYTSDAWSFHDPGGNYADDSGTVSDTISQATATINITPYSVTYNASAHTASGTATGVSSVNLSAGLTLSGTTHTNAGSYTTDAWGFHDAGGNYADSSGTVSDTISQATATINITPYSVTYNASAHTASGTATGVNSVDLSGGLTLSGTTHTNAGSYTSDTWSFHDASGNYADDSGAVSDTISQATASINITPYSVTYNASAHTANGTATGVSSVNLGAGLTLSGTTHTNAGSYTSDAWSFHDASGNYADASGAVSDTISQTTASISVTGYSVNFDGNAHTASGAATGVSSVNLSGDLDLSGTTHTNAGSYTSDMWSFHDPTGNYADASSTVSDTITMLPATASTPMATSLGTINLGSTTTQTVTFTIQTAGSIGMPVVVTEGATGLDFIDAGDGSCTINNGSSNGYSALSTCTVDVRFRPLYPGQRYGAVLLEDTSGNILATAYVYGTGTGPQVNFSPLVESTLGGGFSTPKGVAVDASRNVYISDSTTNLVQEIPFGCTDSSCVTTLGGGFSQPRGTAVDGAGNVYVADYANHAVKEIPVSCIVGTNDSTCVITLGGGFHYPEGVAVDGTGNIYIADSGNEAVKWMPSGCATSSCVTQLGGSFAFNWPRGVAVDGSGNVFVADTNNSAVEEMSPGCASSSCVTTLGGGFSQPNGVAVDDNDNVYVADAGLWAITSMPASCATSSCVTNLNGNFAGPYAVALDQRGNVFIADPARQTVYELDFADAPSLSFVTTAVGFTSTDSPRTATVTNEGNASLDFSRLSIPTDFPLASSGGGVCTSRTILGANTSCTLPINFTPTVTTSLSERLTLTDNSLNIHPEDVGSLNGPQPLNANLTSQSILLSGTGIAPTVTFTAPVSTTLPGGTVGISYSGASFQATGGTAPYTYSGTMPAGLTLSNGGSLSGTPTTVENSYSITVTATDANNFTGQQTYYLTIGQGTATVTLGSLAQTYNGSTHSATATTNPAGLTVDFTYTGIGGTVYSTTSTPPTSVGSYTVTGTIDDTNYTGSNSGTLVISKGTATVTLGNLAQIYNGSALSATATTNPTGLVVSFTYNGSMTPPTTVGSYPVLGTVVDDSYSGTSSGTLVISKATATVTLGNLAQTYTGSALSATAITNPSGLTVNFTYTGTGGTVYGPTSTPPTSVGSYAVVGTISDTNYLGTSSGTLVISKATATVTLGSLAQTYTGSALSATATTNPTGLTVNFTYNGSSTAPTAAGSYTVVGTISDTDYAGSNSGTLIISKVASQVASLISSSNPTAPDSSVTFTATVSSTAGAPTGTVSFVDNTSTTLGQGTLSGGVATLTTVFTGAQAGSNPITAVYNGDTNFLGSSSGVLTETVIVFTLSPGSGNITTQTVTSGGTATYGLSIAPTSGTTFPDPVILTVSGMPSGATATITPSTWTQLTSTSWSFPANTALSAITLAIHLPTTSSMLDWQVPIGHKLPPVLWGILLLPFAGRLRRAGKRMRRTISLMLLLAACVAAMTALGGCGGKSSSSESTSQPSSYTITVTATSGAVSSSTTLTLNVN